VCSNSRRLARMVALEPALRDERVGAGREGVRDHIFEFAGLAAAKREAGVEVIAGEEDLGCA
jgi:hypothetical protein